MLHPTKLTDTQSAMSNVHIARSAALVAFCLAVDKALGIVREMAVGRAFGTSAVLDAYFAAFEVPEGLNTVVTGAALTTALIPVLSHIIAQEDRESLWCLVSSVANWILIVVGVASAIAALYAKSIITLVAPGFADHPSQVILATRLMRLVLIQTMIFSLSTVVTSTLQAHRHFLLPALAPLCYTVGRIFGAIVLAPRMGIFGLAWGGLAGSVLHLLIKLPWLVHQKAQWKWILFHPQLRGLLKLMAPRMLGMGVTYISFVLPTTFGSQLPPGSISAYEYAWKLMQLPETILGTAMGIVILPTLANLADQGNRVNLRHTFSWSLRLILALSMPAAVGLLVLGRPLTALFFQRGAFDAVATDRVYWALQFFALGLITHTMLEVVARLFYAQRDMWTPFWAALGGLAVNVSLSWISLPWLAHGAIALSNSVGVGFQVVFLLLVARERLAGIDGRALGKSILRTGLSSALMGGVVLGFRHLLSTADPLLTGPGILVVGVVIYVLSALLLGNEELRELPALLLGRAGIDL